VIKKYKALALFSGGLDSLLCVLWMEKLGIETIPIFFRTPFFTEERALQTATENGLNLEVIDISAAHLEMMHNPRYGFGKNFNPCIDCHGLMFQMAGSLLEKYNADFLVSGEVLSQRPMSQRRDALSAVAKLSGYRDLLIRPLSQKLLPDTRPIREGWINKDDLLDISGRSRKPQMALAKELGVKSYPGPGGGCLLTDKNFSLRLQDLVLYNQLSLTDITLLRFGRHFRLSEKVKLIVGRDDTDNQNLLDNRADNIIMLNQDIPGPLGLLCHNTDADDRLIQAAAILAHYYKKSGDPVTFSWGMDFPLDKQVETKKADTELVNQYMITRKD
jgi:tRNA U34 2-thiouridine synthase MnmA/TrmU